MLLADFSPHFARDLRKLKNLHRDVDKLKPIVSLLLEQKRIPPKYKDHALNGDYKGVRELHISWNPDWLLLYKKTKTHILFLRMGTHDALFK
ncbi:MAG: type II toxin-antitoxin system YafQ family toxin [Candidatus Ancillula sp.]|jgi:mRNA interferase YafQ|nr:type II toxin-antitoxin system YafQ family toxin [Candidatus Ancillula sp.]